MLLVRINCPDDATAEIIARAAVDARLAACANIAPPIRSVYRWNGRIETGQEVPLLLKTQAGHFEAIEALVAAHHPDAVPAILALPVSRTTEAFGAWLVAETAG